MFKFIDKVIFLGYVISVGSLQMYEEMMNAILGWPIPRRSTGIRSIYGLVLFSLRFIKNFSIIVIHMVNFLRNKEFICTNKAKERKF